MIYSNINNWNAEKELYSETMVKAIRYLQTTDFDALENGEYEIDGRNMYALIMEKETDLKAFRKPESHRKYVDVQYVYNGTEQIGYCRKHDALTIIENKMDDSDYVLYDGLIENESTLTLSKGDFAIFFPEDVHRVLCTEQHKSLVRKVVVKISI